MAISGYLGIDAGTQGLSAVFTNQQLDVLATGASDYGMVADLDQGCYEQRPVDWLRALQSAVDDLRKRLDETMDVLAIGISGQMHGEVLTDAQGHPLQPARLWCDSRNETEGHQLTELLGVKMPKRITAARWLWTLRHQPQTAAKVAHLTTPAGWLANRLTGGWSLGIGDASGMFPIDQQTLKYDQDCLAKFNALVAACDAPPLKNLLPDVRTAGDDAGTLNAEGARLIGLPEGIPVAAAEGDQPAALAGSLIGNAGQVSISFGTSVCANSVGDRAFEGVAPAVDHFCAADGKPINMVWLRNGTTFMNTVVEMLGMASGGSREESFATIMPHVLAASCDCGGLLALPFMDDEPGLGVNRGGTAMVVGLNPENAHPGNVAKAALLATVFNLRTGTEILDAQGFPRTEIVLSGGLTKTPQLGQIVADVFGTPVRLLDTAQEGTAWGAALLAKYRHRRFQETDPCDWASFLTAYTRDDGTRYQPDLAAGRQYNQNYARYRSLLDARAVLDDAIR